MRRSAAGSLAVALVALVALFAARAAFASELRIHVIDVGEGDAILVEAPGDTARWALIDTGNAITGHSVVRYLGGRDVRRLDYLILTHPHLDHAGGVFTVAQTFAVKKLFDNGQDLSRAAQKSDIYRWYGELIRNNPSYRVLNAGDALTLNQVVLTTLWPPRGISGPDFNAHSLVIMVTYGAFRALLCGDLPASSERILMARQKDLAATVLKVGHHAAADAASKGFLRRVAPKVAVVSVNRDNVRGYPSDATLERLKRAGAAVYRTDRDGTVLISAKQDGAFTVTVEKNRR